MFVTDPFQLKVQSYLEHIHNDVVALDKNIHSRLSFEQLLLTLTIILDAVNVEYTNHEIIHVNASPEMD